MKRIVYIAVFGFLSVVLIASITNKGIFDGKSTEYSNLKREPYIPKKQIDATLIISYSEGKSSTYPTKADEGDTVFNLLRTVAAKESIPLEVQEYDFGALVTSIDGVENSEEFAWIYFVNGESGNVGADQKQFESGDEIEWKYTEIEY